MENEVKVETKKKGNGLFTLFACVMTGIIVFLATNIGQKASKTVDPDTPKKNEVTSNVESNTTSNVESNVTSNVDSNVATASKSNDYNVFANNFKQEFSKFNNDNMQSLDVKNSIVGDYNISIDAQGILYVDYEDAKLKAKFGKKKIASNVLSFYLIESGNGGGNVLYFINQNGTVGLADIEYGAETNINIKTDLGYKNIVNVISGVFSAQKSAAASAIFVDIDGKLYNANFKSNNTVETTSTRTGSENEYKIFTENFKNETAKLKNNNGIQGFSVESSIVGTYNVSKDANGSLYVEYTDKTLKSKYGKKKIADNVLTATVIPSGQGGGNALYFINQNGTVGTADVEYGAKTNITVKADLGYKNVVSILPGVFGIQHSGSNDAIFVDINGKLYSENFK